MELTAPLSERVEAWRHRHGGPPGSPARDQTACDRQYFSLAYLYCFNGRGAFAPVESESPMPEILDRAALREATNDIFMFPSTGKV